jgi:hypothetical protein
MQGNTKFLTNVQLIAFDLLIRRMQLSDSPLMGAGNLPTRITFLHDVRAITV